MINHKLDKKMYPKLVKLNQVLQAFFNDPAHAPDESKVIIFTQFRNTA